MTEEQTMTDRTTATRSAEETLEDAVDAYHDARVGAEHAVTVEVVDLAVNQTTDALCARIRLNGDCRWVRLFGTGDRPHWNAVSHLDIPDGFEEADDLVGTRPEFRVGEDSRRLLEPDGTPAGRITRFDPDVDDDAEEFIRQARIERLMIGTPPAAPRRLSATGDSERVKLSATISGETIQWTFDVPDTLSFSGSELHELIDEAGVGDPAGLDGHRVWICRREDVGADMNRFLSDDGDFAIVTGGGIDSTASSRHKAFGESVIGLGLMLIGYALMIQSLAPAASTVFGPLLVGAGVAKTVQATRTFPSTED